MSYGAAKIRVSLKNRIANGAKKTPVPLSLRAAGRGDGPRQPMQLATPKAVAMALRTLSSVCRMNFQVSFFFMVLGFRG